MKLEQNPDYTKLVKVDLLLEVMLVNHPLSTPALIPITVSQKECVPIEFTYIDLPPTQQMVVGDA